MPTTTGAGNCPPSWRANDTNGRSADSQSTVATGAVDKSGLAVDNPGELWTTVRTTGGPAGTGGNGAVTASDLCVDWHRGPHGHRHLRRGEVEKPSTARPTRFRAWRCPFSGLSPPSPAPTTDTSSLVRSNFYYVDTFRAPAPERCPSSVGRRRVMQPLPKTPVAARRGLLPGGRNGKPAPPLHARGERKSGAGRDPGRGATGAQPICVVCSGRTTTTTRSSPGWCHG